MLVFFAKVSYYITNCELFILIWVFVNNMTRFFTENQFELEKIY
jgi:hypothetical protein